MTLIKVVMNASTNGSNFVVKLSLRSVIVEQAVITRDVLKDCTFLKLNKFFILYFYRNNN